MARYTESVCRLCRREGAKLFLKGSRCYTKKCSFERRPTPPGQHGVRRRKVGEYGLQLREKQKVRRIYGVLERQFRNYFVDAENRPGVTGENLLRSLELRLDNVVYRMGFATSRAQARQLVGPRPLRGQRPARRTSRPTSSSPATGSRSARSHRAREPFKIAKETLRSHQAPEWLSIDAAKPVRGRRRRRPAATRCRSTSTSSSWSSTTRGKPPS